MRDEIDYDFEYNYHNIAENADELYDDDWLGHFEGEDDNVIGWDNYYHDILDEIED